MSEQTVECPVDGCGFEGGPESVCQHYTATAAGDHPGGMADFFRKLRREDRPDSGSGSGSGSGPEPGPDSRSDGSDPADSGGESGSVAGSVDPSGRTILVATALFALVVFVRATGSSTDDQQDQQTEGGSDPEEEPADVPDASEVWV